MTAMYSSQIETHANALPSNIYDSKKNLLLEFKKQCDLEAIVIKIMTPQYFLKFLLYIMKHNEV